MNNVGCVAKTIAKKPQLVAGYYLVKTLAETTIVVLTLAGIINKTGFLIGIGAVTGGNLLIRAAVMHQLGAYNSLKEAGKALLKNIFTIANFIIFLTAVGGVHYHTCAWILASFTVFDIGLLLIAYGVKKYIEDSNNVRLRKVCCCF